MLNGQIIDRKCRQDGAKQVVKVENPGRRSAEQYGLIHLVLRHPADEKINSQVCRQQSKGVGTRIGGGKHHVGFQGKKNTNEKRNVLVEELARTPKQKIYGAQHRQAGRNLEGDFLAAKNRPGSPQGIEIADRGRHQRRAAPNFPEAAADLPVGKGLV
jgi:hypothetical protein